MNFTDDELERIYQDLYFRQGNSEKFIDYEVLVNTYKIYLALFFEISSSIYGDCEFLSLVIDGFYYFYNSLFEQEDIDYGIVTSTLCEHDTELRHKNESAIATGTDGDYTDGDAVLVYTFKLAILFKDMELVEDFYDKMQRLFFNSYVIKEMEKEKGCEERAMEYWKCYN